MPADRRSDALPDLADLFPGFASSSVPTDAGRIFARVGGSGPPVVLLHGFPQTHVTWHRVAAPLAERHTVVAMDLRGYGLSSDPESRGDEGYAKRVMGRDVVAVMAGLGHARFALVGHDRGARVGYRLALDEPGRIERLALLDVLPTSEVWRQIDSDAAAHPHWRRLAAAEPGPERDISADPDAYFEGLLRGWSKARSLDAFDPRALGHYRVGWNEPSRVHAFCEDYRAGAGLDRAADEADRVSGRTIGCPVLVLAGDTYLKPAGGVAPVDVWRRTFAPGATGATVDAGHFIAEENAEATLDALLGFL